MSDSTFFFLINALSILRLDNNKTNPNTIKHPNDVNNPD